MKQRIPAIIQGVLIAVVVLSGAIALPVLFRPFFYWHIQPLCLPELVELTVPEIKTAYREVMDYCVGLSDTFSAGSLPFSKSGAAHFADVRKLFLLDLWALAVSAILLVVLKRICSGKRGCLLGHTPGFWSAVGLGAGISVVGALAALDFNKAFLAFHRLFFPGKDNWFFDGRQDPVIYMLPKVFFRNCAILIFATIMLSCIGLLLWDWHVRHKK